MLKIVIVDLIINSLIFIAAGLLSFAIWAKLNKKSSNQISLSWKLFRIAISFAAGFLSIYFLYLCYLVSWPSPEETECNGGLSKIPVTLVPAFINLGKNPITDKYNSGNANKYIANKIDQCNFNLVLTQEAVSDAFLCEGELLDYNMEQMHKDNEIKVGTLEALYCAIARVENVVEKHRIVGLMAHDKHLTRAHQALEAVLKSKFPDIYIEIKVIHLGKTPYQNDNFLSPWCWGFREIFARPVQSVVILAGNISCSKKVEYGTISPN
jgi:hypothetical protein